VGGTGLLVYGSLMHPGSLATGSGRSASPQPVRVQGYRRSFCQEPSWRRGSGAHRGVLTVHAATSWFSGILVRGLSADMLKALDHRERGYRRVAVERSAIEPYGPAPDLDGIDRIEIYVGRRELRNPDLRPNVDYLRLCRDAAAHWGTDFLDDFLSTTHVGSAPLRDLDQRILAGAE
jgi:hypothetical protein